LPICSAFFFCYPQGVSSGHKKDKNVQPSAGTENILITPPHFQDELLVSSFLVYFLEFSENPIRSMRTGVMSTYNP
jgi:hypothetical protein